MIVTDIAELDKRRVKIMIDGVFAFVLYKGELGTCKIKKDAALPEETYRLIMSELLPKRAKLRAMNLLTARAYTEEKLRNKLEEGFYPQAVIEEAIDYVKSFGYINDKAYALEYITYHAPEMNRQQMELKLMQRGIDRTVISQALEEYCAENGAIDELEQIKELLLKKHLNPEAMSAQDVKKTKAMLYRRGFSADSISKAISSNP